MKIEKNKIRQNIRQRLNHLSAEEKKRQSTHIRQKIEQHPAFQRAETVLLYWSLPDEVDTHTFVEKWAKTKTVLLPVAVGENLILREYANCLKIGAFGIYEPVGDEEFTDFSAIDLCIVPAVAFDRAGNRLGRGKGFYDRLLPKIAAPKIGVCFDVQMLDSLPNEAFDVKMDFVISI